MSRLASSNVACRWSLSSPYPPIKLDYNYGPAKRTDPPLTCIEIQSPSQSNRNAGPEEMVARTHVYFAFGVKSCWIVLPTLRSVIVYEQPDFYHFFHQNDTLIDHTTGIELPLATIFA